MACALHRGATATAFQAVLHSHSDCVSCSRGSSGCQVFGWRIRQRPALQVLIELNACFYLTPERVAKLALPQWHAAKQVDEVTLAWALLPWESLIKVHSHCGGVAC